MVVISLFLALPSEESFLMGSLLAHFLPIQITSKSGRECCWYNNIFLALPRAEEVVVTEHNFTF
jgi:hypothetical protein